MQMNDMNGGFDEPDFDGEDPGTGSANGEKPGKDRSMSERDRQSRDWMLTVPAEDHTQDEVRTLFEKIGTGAVFQHETGATTGYEHFQCFLQMKSPMRFSTLKNHLTDAGFGDAHIEPRHGSVEDCVAYCTKPDTRADDPVYVGEIDMKDRQGRRSDLIAFREQILDGVPVQQVLLDDTEAKAAHCTKWLNAFSEACARQEYGNKLRDVSVHYLYGAPGVGKTRYVYDRYPFEDVYRVTDYAHPFDEYDRHRVLVLDDYDSQLPWEQLLSYLDRYPVTLPARYHNHQACFDTVWIISNLPLTAQYPDITGARRLALLRRITDCTHMLADGTLVKEPLPGQREEVNR